MIEFVVVGTPRSHRARSRSQWQATVKNAVPAHVGVLAGALRLRIDFFFEDTTDLDADNIIKSIQDALEGIVYVDDEHVVDVCARKINQQHLPPIIDPSTMLSDALALRPGDFVYIRVATAQPEVTFS
ncbi:RusA family crossover junction endodeoxyribonuclease [Candidatus Poriferisodalis sp.]|uniref:RusA family crossover junction endodeoxyribonuclease n=1 Tax=Candidatus Poriferisodalis sp. TaxID=3101277 RepID=UPI003B02CD11